MALRGIAAFLFVALFGFLLAQPILRSDNAGPDRPPRDEGSPTSGASPSRVPPGAQAPAERTSFRLAGSYPRACLRPVSYPGSEGLVAAYANGAIKIVSTEGTEQATIRVPGGVVKPPLAWSPSGRVLAAGPQGLFWRPTGDQVVLGDVQLGLVQGARGEWGWSPLSDCGVHIDDAGALHVTAANPFVVGAGRLLIDTGVESFSYSPDGRRLGLVLKDGARRGIWVADLVKNRVQRVRMFPPATCCVTLGGWTPSGREVLFWAGPGVSVMADGWPLESVRLGGSLSQRAIAVPGTQLAACGSELVGLVGGDRSGQGARLAVLNRGQERFLSDPSDGISSFSCSPDANFFVVQTDARLSLLNKEGGFIRYLTNIEAPNGQWSESAPEWGPPRTGVLFFRGMHLQSLLWFVSEGTAGERALIEVGPGGRRDIDSLFDWSATPPNGLSARG